MRWGGFRGVPLVAAMLLAGLAPSPQRLSAQAVGQEEVTSLSFDGNRIATDRDLEGAIVTRATRCISPALIPLCSLGIGGLLDRAFRSPRTFPSDLARIKVFYYQRGYREAQVDTVVMPAGAGAVAVRFRIEEGPPHRIGELGMIGAEELPFDPAASIAASAGDPLDLLALDEARGALLSLLRDRGYAHADVLLQWSIPRGSRDATVAFDVDPGPRTRFGSIEVQGNRTLDETVIRRMLPFRSGTEYREELLFEGQRNLFSLELLQQATVAAAPASRADTLIPVRVSVAEGDLHRVRTGAGWSTGECLNGEARWASRNFLGGGRRVQLSGRVGNLLNDGLRTALCPQAGSGEYGRTTWLASVDFVQPFVFSARNSLTAGVYAERQSLQDVFIRRALGVDLSLSRTIGPAAVLRTSFRPQLAELQAAELFFCTSYLVCDPSDIDVLQSPSVLAPLTIGVSEDRVNDLLNPSRGFRALVEYEHASQATGSDYGHDRWIAEGSLYREIGGIVLAGRIRGGWISARAFSGLSEGAQGRRIAHPQKRFYAGGANSVRGFGQNQLGPRILTVEVRDLVEPSGGEPALCTPEAVLDGSCDAAALPDSRFDPRPVGGTGLLEGAVELRGPLLGNLAQWAVFTDFGQVRGENADLDPGRFEVTPGAGLRYLSPIGPLRLDVAWRSRGSEEVGVVTSRIRRVDGVPRGPTLLDGTWEIQDELVLLEPGVSFGEGSAIAWRRFQIHLSIGQAF